MNLLNFFLAIPTAQAQVTNQVGGAVDKVGGETSNQLTKLVTTLFEQVPLWIAAVIVAFLSYLVAVIVKRTIENKLTQEGLDEEHKEVQIMAGRLSFFAVLTIGITIALSIVGINLQPIVAAGAFGLGFALQDIIMNLISGMMILASHHYSIGDVITVSGISGKIEEIQTRATIIKAFDGTKVIVPNAQLFKNVVVSKTSNPYRKVSFLMGVGYGTDLKGVMDLTLAVVKNVPWVLKKPKASVVFTEWGDSSINFKINIWIDSKGGKMVKTKNQIIMDLTTAYNDAGIDIPYPIQTLNFDLPDHSSETESQVASKIKQIKNRLKGKTASHPLVPGFPSLNEVAPLPISQIDQQAALQQSQATLESSPTQPPLAVSPQPTINSSAQNWLQQALADQSANLASSQTLPVAQAEPLIPQTPLQSASINQVLPSVSFEQVAVQSPPLQLPISEFVPAQTIESAPALSQQTANLQNPLIQNEAQFILPNQIKS